MMGPINSRTETALDPTLSALFASSSGPVKVPSHIPTKRLNTKITRDPNPTDLTLPDVESSSENSPDSADEAEQVVPQPRKRRKLDTSENLENEYFNKLAQEEARELQQRHEESGGEDSSDEEQSTSSAGGDADIAAVTADGYQIPLHETVSNTQVDVVDDVKRTVFLGNVSNDAIKSKSAKKTLVAHLEQALSSKNEESVGKLKTLRFRSTAFVNGAGPKRATFAKKELMDETTNNTNAYAVFSTEQAARKVATALNGSIVLDRHLRVDYLGEPAKIDHRRCVFVGNLSFVDEETPDDQSEGPDGQKRRPRGKIPADVEEGLWRTFGRAGKVESVRVIRDKETRVGKGIAYVQFQDENAVEMALSFNEKKFPPMLPRKLRVSRARRTKPSQSTRSDLRERGAQTVRNRFSTGSRSGAANRPRVVFEGHRASSNSSRFALKQRKKHKSKPTNRSSRRGAAFKAAGKEKRSSK